MMESSVPPGTFAIPEGTDYEDDDEDEDEEEEEAKFANGKRLHRGGTAHPSSPVQIEPDKPGLLI